MKCHYVGRISHADLNVSLSQKHPYIDLHAFVAYCETDRKKRAEYPRSMIGFTRIETMNPFVKVVTVAICIKINR
jgi:hypothetical protein